MSCRWANQRISDWRVVWAISRLHSLCKHHFRGLVPQPTPTVRHSVAIQLWRIDCIKSRQGPHKHVKPLKRGLFDQTNRKNPRLKIQLLHNRGRRLLTNWRFCQDLRDSPALLLNRSLQSECQLAVGPLKLHDKVQIVLTSPYRRALVPRVPSAHDENPPLDVHAWCKWFRALSD